MSETSIAKRRRNRVDIVDALGARHVRLNSFHPELQSALDRSVLDVRRTQTKLLRGQRRAVPKYGMFTLLARKTSFFIYDHPVFESLCNTAFTDGRHVYFSAKFMQGLLDSEHANPGCVEVLPLVLHELSHIIYQHHGRLLNCPHELKRSAFKYIRNVAMDKAINARIKASFPDMPFGPYFLESAWGLDDVDKYIHLLEEQIFSEDLRVELAKEQQQGSDNKPDPGENGMGAPDASQGGGAEGDVAGEGRHNASDSLSQDTARAAQSGSADSGPAEPEEGSDHNHVVSTAELARVIGEALDKHPELKGVADALDIDVDSPEKNAHVLTEQTRAVRSCLNEAKELASAGLAPGGHVERATAEAIGELDSPTIDFRLAVGEIVHDAGRGSSSRDYDDPHSAYYLDPGRMGLNSKLYAPSVVPKGIGPKILVLLDTSGSVSRKMRISFLSQIKPILFTEDSGVKARVWLFSGDTVVRDEPTVLTQDNFDELQSGVIKGNGGTDLAAVINSAMEWAEEEDVEFDAVLYFTDLMDFAPASAKLARPMPPTVFICPRDYRRQAFAAAVGDYAIVADIRDDTSIDLAEVAADVTERSDRSPAP